MKRSIRQLSRRFRFQNIPLRVVLILPFMLELMLAVGLTAYIAYRHGQDALNDIANQLMVEVSNRVENHLDNYLEIPVQVINDNVNAIELGLLDWHNLQKLERYFGRRLEAFGESKYELQSLLLVDETQKIVIVENQPNTSWSSNPPSSTSEQLLRRYGLLNEKNFDNSTEFNPNQHSLQGKDWYQAVKQVSQGTWQLVPIDQDVEKSTLIAVYLKPFYDANHVSQGVIGASIDLENISQYLSSLNISPRGQAFIVDTSGTFIATSTREELTTKSKNGSANSFLSTDKTTETNDSFRLQASQSLNSATRDAAYYVKQTFGSFASIPNKQQLSFEVHGKPYFLQVTPLRHPKNLNWFLVVVIPKADFVAQLDRQYQTVLGLSGLAMIGAIALGLATAQGIARPILRLSRASRDLMLGKLDAPVNEQTCIAELAVMAHSFNEMTEQVLQSFDQVKLALQESKEKFTTVFRTSPDPIMVTTLPEGTILEVNESFLQLTGISREEVVGKTAIELGLWTNLEDRNKLMQTIRETGRVCDQEVTTSTRYGTQITVLLSSEQIELEGRSCLLTVAKDISERKQLEEALRQSETQLQNVLNTAAAAICYFYIDDSRFPRPIYFSAGVKTIFGYSPGVMLSDFSIWHKRVHPEDWEKLIKPSFSEITDNESIYIEYRYDHPQTGQRWIAADINAHWDTIHNYWLVTSVEFDITARKRTEEALRVSEASFRMAFDTAAIGMDLASLDGRLLQVNPALCQMLGYSQEDLLQLTYQDITHPDDYKVDCDANQKILSGQVSSLSFEKRFVHRDGQVIWIFISLALIRDSQQQPLYWVAQVQNITVRKQIESALRQSEARFRAVFETAMVGIAIADLEGSIVEANDALCRICSFSKTEMQNMQLQQIIHPEDLPRWSKLVQELNSQLLAPYQLKTRCLRKEGGFIWAQLKTILIRDSNEHPLYLVTRIESLSTMYGSAPQTLPIFYERHDNSN